MSVYPGPGMLGRVQGPRTWVSCKLPSLAMMVFYTLVELLPARWGSCSWPGSPPSSPSGCVSHCGKRRRKSRKRQAPSSPRERDM